MLFDLSCHRLASSVGLALGKVLSSKLFFGKVLLTKSLSFSIIYLRRLVEPQDGIIEIDDLDISAIGLNALRTRIAFVPQDTTLFLGTLRDNL